MGMAMPNKPSRETIAENVRKYRRQRGMTQQALAAAVSEDIGKPYAHTRIAEIEAGKYAVTSDVLDRLADALEVPPATLLIPAEVDAMAVA